MADANPQNRDEGMSSNSAVDRVKWQDLMSTLILDRLEASFDNWDDELPHTTGRMTQNTKTDCDCRSQQCTIVEGESSRMAYFDSACYGDDIVNTTTDRDSIACTSLLYDCSTDGFLDGNNSYCRCDMKPQYSLSCLTNNPSSRESISEKIKKNETENIKQQVEIFRNRLECSLKINYQLQSELKKTIRKNLLMEQYITWPYAVNNGKVEFPGKNDLDQRFDCLFKELEKIRNELKPIQNESYIVRKLEKILHIPLPGCLNTCNKYMNKK
ncbi:uncharacterized protein LOC103310291 [Acyrthosiphon pisum]|uniref:Uncharacterized protein n=1 Tax=Acyrthosiphon pisum TaxID=7029 RepID=A0A8R2B8I7_ACYPI|nr:uncharacterized protein LOC103310291 [Acyrthosiphon pisum]|eukprot:XP_008186300.1 PREDICTED: uncharacterized protein LOC103310291 [Acyrthosiphon pisum]